MNAIQILDEIRGHGAELLLRDGKLVLRGSGPRLPGDLQASIEKQKAELMVALGAPIEETVASILADIRPNLPPALRALPDASPLALVNWSMLHAWSKAARGLTTGARGG